MCAAAALPERGICGHGGDLADCPEDSVVGLKSAVAKGAQMVEFDVQRCKTGELVVLHDGDLSRKTTVTGVVSRSSLAYIRSARLRSRKYPNEKVPTIDEMLDALPRSGVIANVHCYGDAFVARDAAIRIREKGLIEQTCIASDLAAIANARKAVPEVRACNMTRPGPPTRPWTLDEHRAYLKATIDNRCQYIQIRFRWPKELSDEAHRAGVKINYCPVNCEGQNPDKLEEILDFGADYVFCENLSPVICRWRELMDNPVPAGEFAVWTADSMRRVGLHTYPDGSEMSSPASAEIAIARNERESAQICITCGSKRSLSNVNVELSPLVSEVSATPLDGEWKWERVGYVPRMKNGELHPFGLPRAEAWLPDPLLPAAPFGIKSGRTQCAWITVYAAPGARPGVYTGTARVTAEGGAEAVVKVKVSVSGTALPKTFSTCNAFAFSDKRLRKMYPRSYTAMHRAAMDMMLDHRLSPDDLYRSEPPQVGDLFYARSRGMNHFNIMNVPYEVPGGVSEDASAEDILDAYMRYYPKFLSKVRPYVDELRRHGLDKMAYFYGFDERGKNFYPAQEFFWKSLARDVPGIPFMTTSRSYEDVAKGVTNILPAAKGASWFCPEVCVWNEKLSRQWQKDGKKIWWYVCCGPHHPYANFASLEAPPMDARILGWMTRFHGVDGFLYWAVNYWANKTNVPMDESGVYLNWDSSIDHNKNGDGVLAYPGKNHLLPSIRLANVRDGVEDGELLKMLYERDGKAADAACRRFLKTTTNFKRDPVLVRKSREVLLAE